MFFSTTSQILLLLLRDKYGRDGEWRVFVVKFGEDKSQEYHKWGFCDLLYVYDETIVSKNLR